MSAWDDTINELEKALATKDTEVARLRSEIESTLKDVSCELAKEVDRLERAAVPQSELIRTIRANVDKLLIARKALEDGSL